MKGDILVNGKIPAFTACPWDDICELKALGQCLHKGLEHNTEFSCGLARFHKLIDKEMNTPA